MTSDYRIWRLPQHDWCEPLPIEPAVQVGGRLFIAGQVASSISAAAAAQGIEGQAVAAFEQIQSVVEQAGGSMADLVSVTSFTRDPRDIRAVLEVGGRFLNDPYPAWTAASMIGTLNTADDVVVKAVADLGPGTKTSYRPESCNWMSGFPMAAGCRKGDILSIAGQTAADSDGTIAPPFDHLEQATIAYRRMNDVLVEAGGSFEDVLDFTSFHQDIRGAEATLLDVYMPNVMAGATSETAATTSHIGVPGLVAPGVIGCYSATADLSEGERLGSTPDSIWWKGIYAISGGAMKARGSIITIAGQVASASDGSLVGAGDPDRQAHYIFSAMREILEGFDASMKNVAEITSFHKDARSIEAAMEVARGYLDDDHLPAWTPIAVPGLWVEGFLHEIAAVAVV